MDELVSYFRNEGWSTYGYRGDEDGLSPKATAIRAMKEFEKFLQHPIGKEAHLKYQYQILVEKGLVPA